jgi:hypothetical protein
LSLSGSATLVWQAAMMDGLPKIYVRFVDLVNDAVLGGGRFAGEKPR